MRSRGHLAGLALATASVALASAVAEAGETVAYSYDALGRLTATSTSGTVNNGLSTGISYDPAGNRSSYAVTGAAGSPPAPPANNPPTALGDSATQQECSTAVPDGLTNDSDVDHPPVLESVTGDGLPGGVCAPPPAPPPTAEDGS